MGIWDYVKPFTGAQVVGGFNLADRASGGAASDAANRAIDSSGIGSGVESYFMGPKNAAEAQQEAARQAQAQVAGGYGQALGTMQPLSQAGVGDYNAYRQAVQGGQFQTDPSAFQTGVQGFNRTPQQARGQAPGFNPFQAGQAPGFNQFERGASPQFNQFQRQAGPGFQETQRGQGPEFQRAEGGDFQFDYKESPGYKFTRDEAIRGVEGRASAQGRRMTGGTDREIAELSANLAAQDYDRQYGRARGAFESERGFGERQAGAANQFGQRQFEFGAGQDLAQGLARNQMAQQAHQFGTGLDAQQQNLANQQALANYQFGTQADIGQSNLANQMAQQNYQFGTNIGLGQSNLGNQLANQNFWQGAGMDQAGYQFGVGVDQAALNDLQRQQMAANAQNYGMFSQQAQQQAGLMGGLGTQGLQSGYNLANLQIGQGEALANAALGLGNANQARAMATQNTVNPLLNVAGQVGGAALGAMV